MFSQYLSRHDSLSQATTVAGSSSPSSYGDTSPPSANPWFHNLKEPAMYAGPRRTFSLVRGNDPKNTIRLVDKAHVKGQTSDDFWGDYQVDFIAPGRFSEATTVVNSRLPSQTSEQRPGNYAAPVKATGPRPSTLQQSYNPREETFTQLAHLSKDEWSNLQLDTDEFLPSILSSTQYPRPLVAPAGSIDIATRPPPPNPSLASVIKAKIKKSGKGFVVRLLHQGKLGREEIADIHMSEELETRKLVSNWVRGKPSSEAPMMSTDEFSLDPLRVTPVPIEPWMTEIGGTQVLEMMDTSKPVELHDTGFFPFPFSNRQRGLSSPSVYSTVSTTSQTSSPNQESIAGFAAPFTSAVSGPQDFTWDRLGSTTSRSTTMASPIEPSVSLTRSFNPINSQAGNSPVPDSADPSIGTREFSFAASEPPSIIGPSKESIPEGQAQYTLHESKLPQTIIKPKRTRPQVKGSHSTVSFENSQSSQPGTTSSNIEKSPMSSLAGKAGNTSPSGSSQRVLDDNDSRSIQNNHTEVPAIQDNIGIDGTPKSNSKVPLSLITQDQHDLSLDRPSLSEVSPRLLSALEQIEHLASRLGTQYRELGFESDAAADDWMYRYNREQEIASAATTAVTQGDQPDPNPPGFGMRVYSFAALVAHSLCYTILGSLGSLAEGYGTSVIPRDHVRVRWTCKCGKQLFDDFVENTPGAARLLEQELNRPRQHVGGSGSTSSSTSGSSPSMTSLRTQSTSATSIDPGDISSARPLSSRNPYTPILTAQGSSVRSDKSPFYEQLWLLTCAERDKFTTKLIHLDADQQKMRSDKELALLIKEQYFTLRPSWRQALRLRGLNTIKFVQFEVHRSKVVDIRKCPDIPTETDLDYSFVPSDLIPPVGERYLMHLFHHPEDYEDELITYKRIPKKRGAMLKVENADVGVRWGIHLVEGFLPYKVWTLFTSLFVLVSLVFAITWAVRKGDVQGAFGVAAYVCALATLIIGCGVAYPE